MPRISYRYASLAAATLLSTACFTQLRMPDGAPRQIAPISLGDVTLRRPTLRWELQGGATGAVVELCRDRGCTNVIETIRATGTSTRPTMDLPPRSVVFWRVKSLAGTTPGAAQSPVWLFHVPAQDNSGAIDTSASPHLDVNGDGFDDVIVGSLGGSTRLAVRAGTVAVFHGSEMGISATPHIVLDGVAATDEFGRTLANVGDLNGDGFGDIGVGTYQADPDGVTDAGTASIYHGSPTGLSTTATIVLKGAAANNRFGVSLAGAGDVNADGYGDLIVGTYAAPPGRPVGSAMASIFHGSAQGVSPTASRVLVGVSPDENFGAMVAAAGDVNGDGFSDIAVGAPQATVGAMLSNNGSVSIYHGSAMGIGMMATQVLAGTANSSRFGGAIAHAGDVNNDGFSELIVGAEQASPGGRAGAGLAVVFQGSMQGLSATPLGVFNGAGDGDHFGVSVSSAGDVNGDGFSDVVVGAYDASPMARSHAGTASVFQGSAMGVSSTPTVVLEGSTADTRLGWSVAGAGDINKDGYSDLIIGAQSGSPGGRVNAGIASIFHGAMSGLSVMPVRVLEGVAEADFFGISVASLDRNPRRVMHRGHFLRSLFN